MCIRDSSKIHKRFQSCVFSHRLFGLSIDERQHHNLQSFWQRRFNNVISPAVFFHQFLLQSFFSSCNLRCIFHTMKPCYRLNFKWNFIIVKCNLLKNKAINWINVDTMNVSWVFFYPKRKNWICPFLCLVIVQSHSLHSPNDFRLH